MEHDKETGSVTVVAGYGQQMQWYQNLDVHPDTIIQICNHKRHVTTEFITSEESDEIMTRYMHRYDKLAGQLFSMFGYSWDGTEEGVRQIARDSLRFVRFNPLSRSSL